MKDPHQVTRDFEAALCEYTGAKYAVTVNSCTAALHLCFVLAKKYNPSIKSVTLPKHTYCSVPMVAVQAGFKLNFSDIEWKGGYIIAPFSIWDCARRFTTGMYHPGTFQCVSFHWSKILGIQQGGAILHDNANYDAWLRAMRFDGRTEGIAPKDDSLIIGHHYYMSPEVAAAGLKFLSILPKWNEDLPNDDYPDLSQQQCFKKHMYSEEKTDADAVIDKIERLRHRNNGNWMNLLRIAYGYDPEATKKVMTEIFNQDQEISDAVKELL